MKSCEEIARIAGDFVERRLGFGERMGVRLHLAMCRGCSAFVDQMRWTLAALEALPAPPAPAPGDELLRVFREETGHSRGGSAPDGS